MTAGSARARENTVVNLKVQTMQNENSTYQTSISQSLLPCAFMRLTKFFVSLLCMASLIVATGTATATERDEFFVEIGDKTVTVVGGDTLHKLAKNEYGSPAFWRLIAEYNNLTPSAKLQQGQIIKLPVLLKRQFEFADVSFVKGDVFLNRAGEDSRELTRDDSIFLEDVVKTGKDGFASLTFRSGSVVHIQPQSEIELVRLRCLENDATCVLGISAIKGEVSSNVQRVGDQPTDFRIFTPYATAAVRGTEFDFQAGSGTMLVGVTEGNVDIESSGTQNNLLAGFGSVTNQGGVAGEPIALIEPPTFKGIPARFAEGDKISWWRPLKSDQYIVSVASDAASSEVVTQVRQANQVYQFGELNPGAYFVNVRSVDENGLKGFPTSQKVNVVKIDPDAGTYELAANREGQNLTLNVTEPRDLATGYEFQVSSSSDFDDVISLDIGQSGTVILKAPEGDLFARARALIGTQEVSEFGPSLRVN